MGDPLTSDDPRDDAFGSIEPYVPTNEEICQRLIDYCLCPPGEYVGADAVEGSDHGHTACFFVGWAIKRLRGLGVSVTEPDLRQLWSCRSCGPHPESRSNWCAVGCGRDYNTMTLVPGVSTEPSQAEIDAIRRVLGENGIKVDLDAQVQNLDQLSEAIAVAARNAHTPETEK